MGGRIQRNDSRRELHEVSDAAAGQREVLHLLAVHHLADVRIGGFEQRRFRRNGDGFGHRADFESDLDIQHIAHAQLEARALVPLETRLFGDNAVGAGGQVRGFIIAFGVGRGRRFDARFRMDHAHGNAGDHRSGGVADAPGNPAERVLREERGGSQ